MLPLQIVLDLAALSSSEWRLGLRSVIELEIATL